MIILWIKFFIIKYILIVAFKPYNCDHWEYKLAHDILEGYDPSIRPSIRHNSTINVTFGLALTQLIDVDERNMIITTNCWLNQGWIDHKLKWDPKDYDGIEFIHIPHEKIWRPDILLVNNADSLAKTSSISTNAIVKHDGNVTWLSTVIFKSSCSINVRYFPFDEQTCDMIFSSWTFDGFFLDVNVNSGEGDLTNYIKNGEWHLVRLTAIKYLRNYSCCEEPYPEIYYKLVIRRRPLYYVFNMVFPCLLITLVAFLGFYLPPGSTEKVSIGITTLLSITVFLMLVAESMPPTSEQLPLLGIYYAVTIGIVSMSTAMAVVTLNINNKGNKGKRVPQIVKIIFFKYMATILRTQISDRAKESVRNAINRRTNNLKYERNLVDKKYQNLNHVNNLAYNSPNKASRKIDIPKESTYSYPRNDFTIKPNKLLRHAASSKSRILNQDLQNCSSIEIRLINKNEGLILEAVDDYFHLSGLNKIQPDDLTNPSNSFIMLANGSDETVSSSKIRLNQSNKLLIKPSDLTSKSPSKHESELFNTNCPMHCICECSSLSLNQSAQGNTNGSSVNLKSKSNLIKKDNEELSLNETILSKSNKPRTNSICTGNNTSFSCNLNQNAPNLRRNSGSNKIKFDSNFLNDLEKLLDKQFTPLVKSIVNTLDKNEKRIYDKEIHEQVQSEWTDLALVADHFFCYFFPIMTLVIYLLIFLNSPHVFAQW